MNQCSTERFLCSRYLSLASCNGALPTPAVPESGAPPALSSQSNAMALPSRSDCRRRLAMSSSSSRRIGRPTISFKAYPARISRTTPPTLGRARRPATRLVGGTLRLEPSHSSFLQDYDNGKMDGFDAGLSAHDHLRPFGYAPSSEAAPYHEWPRNTCSPIACFRATRAQVFRHTSTSSAEPPRAGHFRLARERQSLQPESPAIPARAAATSTAVVVDTLDISHRAAGPTPLRVSIRPS